MAESNSQDPVPAFQFVPSQSYLNQYQYTGQQNLQPYQQYLFHQNQTDPNYRGRPPRGRPLSRRGRGRYAPNFDQHFVRGNVMFPPPRQMGDPRLAFHPPDGIYSNYVSYNQMPDEMFMQGQPRLAGARGHGYHPQQGPSRGQGNQQGNQQHRASRNSSSKVRNRPKYEGSNESQTGSMIEQLTEGSYECTVCCETVRCDAAIWNCQECYTVFHLKCIKKWAKSPAAAAEDSDGWQCPMCRNITLSIPYAYKCFCSKQREPPYYPGEMPHSCGEVCRRKRLKTNCVHACNILCHPGPCPPCPASTKQQCLCKKTSQTIRCGTGQVIRCEAECSQKLNCGIHSCEEVCHEGNCQPCQVELNQGCFCGKESRTILCSIGEDGNQLKDGGGQYACKALCGRTLACGNHSCKRLCHPGPCDLCPLTPDSVTKCPCGQVNLSELAAEGEVRKTCLHPIPTCTSACGKPLQCGGEDVHICKDICHEGECPPCPLTSTVRCRCGHRMIDALCRELIQAYDPVTGQVSMTCDRKCPKKKHCGKHKCNVKCCVAREHQCIQVCGRMLNCGMHRCDDLCHPGNCVRCLNASFDEFSCHCGATVMMPPIRCGTKPPECDKLCARQHDCEHPVRHTCHSEEVCPPCVELTSKMCMGNHEKRYNIPCHIKDISCGCTCGKKLPCGMHACTMLCHKGPCKECKQPCLKPRPECGHPCLVPCHLGMPCPITQCKSKFTIRCACGNRSETMQCLQGGDDVRLTEAFQRLATSTMAGQGNQSGQDVDISELMALRNSKKQRQLECDQQCAVISRKKRLAEALDIKDPDTCKFPTVYNVFLKEQARKNPQFIASVTKDMTTLVTTAQASKHPSRSQAFPPMNQNNRRIVHELSEMYGCETQSYDQEPKRNVVTTARKGTCFIPNVSLTTVIERETHPKAPPPIVHTKHEAPRRLTSLSKMPRPESPTSPPIQQNQQDADVPDSWEGL